VFACKKNRALRPACTYRQLLRWVLQFQKPKTKGRRAANLTTALGGQRSCYATVHDNGRMRVYKNSTDYQLTPTRAKTAAHIRIDLILLETRVPANIIVADSIGVPSFVFT